MFKEYVFLLYVACKKFPTNQFVKKFCPIKIVSSSHSSFEHYFFFFLLFIIIIIIIIIIVFESKESGK
jgi:hypothetical protein